MGLAKLVAGGLAAMLGAVFIMAGGVKVTDQIDPGVHAEMTEKFHQFHQIWKVDERVPGKTPEDFQTILGLTEIACGVALLFPVLSAIINLVLVPLGFVVNWVLMVLMAGAVYTHMELKESVAPPAVLLGLLLLYTIVSIASLMSGKPRPVAGTEASTVSTKKEN